MNDQLSQLQLGDLVMFVRNDLPILNRLCRDGSFSLSEWLGRTRVVVSGAESTVHLVDQEGQLLLHQMLGFILASAERHAQANGHEPGWVLRELPGLERSLILASAQQRAPVLTPELYWERNDARPYLSFTREPHELFFISAVRTQVTLRAVANWQLRALLGGGWSPTSAEGAHLLWVAVAAMKEAHGQYFDFRRGPQGTPLMTPAQFNEMRLWLASTIIGGKPLAGANAAYIAEMVVTDFLLGTADAEYDDYVRGFEMYQSPTERQLVAADRARTSMVLLLADSLGLGPAELDRASVEEVANRMRMAPVALCLSFRAFKSLMEEFIACSGTHVGLIHIYLEKYAREIPSDRLAQMPVKPTHGTGGHSHEHTRRLHGMRRGAPRIRKLLMALKEVV